MAHIEGASSIPTAVVYTGWRTALQVLLSAHPAPSSTYPTHETTQIRQSQDTLLTSPWPEMDKATMTTGSWRWRTPGSKAGTIRSPHQSHQQHSSSHSPTRSIWTSPSRPSRTPRSYGLSSTPCWASSIMSRTSSRSWVPGITSWRCWPAAPRAVTKKSYWQHTTPSASQSSATVPLCGRHLLVGQTGWSSRPPRTTTFGPPWDSSRWRAWTTSTRIPRSCL